MYDYNVSKKLQEDERYKTLLSSLSKNPVKLWEDGSISVGSLDLTQHRVNQICLANGMKKLVLGFEAFEDLIRKNDKKGIILFTNDASKRFYRNIENIRNSTNCAILMISHDLHVVMSSSNRVICVNGHICCEGAPESVATSPEYKALFGSDVDGTFALYRHHHDHKHDSKIER